MKRTKLFFVTAGIALSQLGCAVSDMDVLREAKILGRPPEEVIFHFGGGLNMAMIIGRSLALLLLAFWFFNMERKAKKKVLTFVLAVPLLLGALYLFGRDWALITTFRIEVLDEGLLLRVPPAPELRAKWDEIIGMEVKGESHGWNVDPSVVNPSFNTAPSWENWTEMDLELTGNRSYHLNLKPISVEQRKQIWMSIKFRAEMSFVKP